MASRTLLANPWAARRDRAARLRGEHPHAAELLALYRALAECGDEIAETAAEIRPSSASLPRHAATRAIPLVIEMTLRAGPQPLRDAVASRFQEPDIESMISRWLDGEALPETDAYLARASTAPILEALPDLAAATGQAALDARHCPGCGGKPQLSFFGASDEALVTAPRHLLCSRCSGTWAYPRMVCAGCGNADSSKLPIYSDPDRFPALRVDACEECSRYLVTVEIAKQPAAIPIVDELVALPLDLYARERGFNKITPNLMGF